MNVYQDDDGDDEWNWGLSVVTCLCTAGGTVRRLLGCCRRRTGWRRVAGGTDVSPASCRPMYTRGWRALSMNRRRCQCVPPRRVLSRNDNIHSLLQQPTTTTREMMRPGTSSSSLPASTTAAAVAGDIYTRTSINWTFFTRNDAGWLRVDVYWMHSARPLSPPNVGCTCWALQSLHI